MKNTAEIIENNCNSEELTIKERIKTEFDRIIVFFEDMNSNEREVLLPLIQNAAFMRVTLENLQDLIQRDGVVDVYMNGENQYGTKQSAALQSYNSLIKNYSAIIKSLKESLPPERRAAFSPSIPREKTAEEIAEERQRLDEENEQLREKFRRFHEEVADYQKWKKSLPRGSDYEYLSMKEWQVKVNSGEIKWPPN